MSRRVLGSLTVMGLVLGSWSALSQSGPPGSSAPPTPPRDLLASAFRVGFVPAPAGTAGQYLLQHRAASASFSDRGVDLRLAPHGQRTREVGWRLVGARTVLPQAEKPHEEKLNRFVEEHREWERNVPTYGGVRYPEVLPGVDLWFEERAEGVEYGLRAERGEALRHTRLEYTGARTVRVVEAGRALEVDLGDGVLREEGLRCEQEARDGSRREVGCRFADARRVAVERWQYAIEVDVEAPDLPVVVDPVIVWSNYVGFDTDEEFGDLVRSDAGEVFITGSLDVLGPSNQVPVQGTPLGKGLLVARFAADGGMSARTLINGDKDDTSRALVLDGRKVYVAGITRSSNFGGKPTNGGTRGAQDGFVARLDADSLNVEWIHFIDEGDGGTEDIHDLALGPQGSLIVVGSTALPLGGSPLNQDILVTRIDPNASGDGGTQRWSTVLRGTKQDVAYAVAVDDEKIYVTGMTGSLTLFPSPVRRHAGPDGVTDVFLMSLNPDAGEIDKATYVGGQGEDEGRALAFMSPGPLVVGGTTRSRDFPVSTSPSSRSPSAFVMLADRTSLVLEDTKTRALGDGSMSEGRAIAVSSEGIVYLGGVTQAPSIPLMNAFDSDFGDGGSEGFVLGFDFTPSTPLLKFSSFVGGNKEDAVLALQSDEQGNLYLGGQTTSEDLVPPGTPGQDTQAQGASDMFLMRVDPNRDPSDGGMTPDAGEVGDGGMADAGSETDGGATTSPDPPLKSPLGFSCGSTGPRGGSGALALVWLVALALLTSRRRAAPPRGH